MEVEFETEVDVVVVCPKCGHHFEQTTLATGITDIDLSDYAPDYSYRD